MGTKSKITRDMTKVELIEVIKGKMSKVKPSLKAPFLKRLKYKTKPQLKRMATRMKVEADKTGYDITYR